MKIVLASGNAGKLREFKEILEPIGFEVISQKEVGISDEAEENGVTFEENAEIKARFAYEKCGLPTIADDSGLSVDFLDGKPGVYSARYAEVGNRRKKILDEMDGVPEEKRNAHFSCAICFIDENGKSHTALGECHGKIGFENRGENGFGYDSIFMYGEKSFAEISADEKNIISHRAKALEKFVKMIGEIYVNK